MKFDNDSKSLEYSHHVESTKCSAVVLAGGLNSRMGGKNKAFLKIGDSTILERLLTTLKGIFSEIILVTREPDLYKNLEIKVVTDIFSMRCSLVGLYSGLIHSNSEFSFVCACDTPFLNKNLIKLLLSETESFDDLVVPLVNEHLEPLCAIYSKRCIKPMERQLSIGDPKILNLFQKIKIKRIRINLLKSADPQLISFFNVNTPADLKRARGMLKDYDP